MKNSRNFLSVLLAPMLVIGAGSSSTTMAAAAPAAPVDLAALRAEADRLADAVEPEVIANRRWLHQHPELSNREVEVIGMLPAELQQTTIYSAGISTSAKNADGARALIKALTTPEAVVAFKSKGLDPL